MPDDQKPFTPPTLDFNGGPSTVETYVDFTAGTIVLRFTQKDTGRFAQLGFTLDQLQVVIDLLEGSKTDLKLHLMGKGSQQVGSKHKIVES